MNDQLPEALIFMRVGNHAGETFESILARKKREYEEAGKIFWGYGGTTLHPTKHVQPFAKMWVEKKGSIRIVMQPSTPKLIPMFYPPMNIRLMESIGNQYLRVSKSLAMQLSSPKFSLS